MKKIFSGLLGVVALATCLNSANASYFDATTLNSTKSIYVHGCLSHKKSDVTLKLTDKTSGEDVYFGQLESDDYGRFSLSFKTDCDDISNYQLSVYQNGTLCTGENATIMAISDVYDDAEPQINITSSDTGADINVKVNNKYFCKDYTYQIICGVYDSDNRLIKISKSNKFTADEVGETVSVGNFDWSDCKDATYVKCFLWNDTDALKPLNQCRIITPNDDYRNTVVFGDNLEKNSHLTFNFLGDSITFGDLTTKPYPYFIADKLNLYYNYDHRWPVRENYPDVMHHVDNNELEINQVNDYGWCGNVVCDNGGLKSSVSMLGRYKEMDPNADIVFIMGGTNDYAFSTQSWVNRELGTADDEGDTTFCGAYFNMIKGIKNMYPTSQVVVLTPIKRNGGQNPNGYGSTLEDYVNAEIAIADKLNVPSIDLYHASELDFDTLGWKTYTVDGLHPNEKGDELLADYIVDKIVEKNIIEIR